ncbi:MAG: FAD-dependent oxidoreductase, partial [Pricia sp.]
LSTDIHPNKNPHIDAPFGYGEVLGTGRIDTNLLVTSYKNYLLWRGHFLAETFDYDALDVENPHVVYKSQKARQIVFADGFGMKKNPIFNYLPMQGSKGEYLFIEAPDLNEKSAIKSSVFVIPEGDNIYRVGANYERNDKSGRPTEQAKKELLKKLESLIRCDYNVVDQVAGVRPTVSDRRPLVGRHPKFQNVYILNGFGSRGVMTGPYASGQLYRHIEANIPLDPEMDIARFAAKHFTA